MARYLPGKAMPLRLLLSGVAAALLLGATVLTGLYLGMETRNRFQRIDNSWRSYSAEADRRGELLSRIRGHLGYGGIIHNFKNFVLRQDRAYLDRVSAQFADFKAVIREYRKSEPRQEELAHLAAIEATIAEYESKLPIAIQAAEEGWTPVHTDRLVKVDDTNALKALAALDSYWRDKRRQSTHAIARSVQEGKSLVETGFRYLAYLALVALVVYALFYVLQRELRQTVGLLSNELAERKAAEHVAKKFSRAVEQSPATIIITDTQGAIEYVNPKFCALSGYAPEEVIGRTPHLLQSPDMPAGTYTDLRRQIDAGEEWRGTFKNLKKDGGHYWVQTAIFPLRDEDGEITHFIGVGEDITEGRKAREQIHKAQKMEAVGLLASGVAHDFNNVLTTILGNVHLALLETPPDGDVRQELEQIDIAAKRARHLVAQILAFARRQPGEPVSVRMGEAVEEVCRLMRASIQSNIALECNIKDETLSVFADPTRLHQVIMNLCSNAAEAIGGEDGRITILVEQAGAGNGADGLVRLVVSDDGPGIAEKNLESIFEPFFSTKPAGKGTGLGLSVVSNLVGEMGGTISVTSEMGEGTAFEILLRQSAIVPEKVEAQENAVGGRERVLLVDDEADVVSTCRKLLHHFGYEVDAYTDPMGAVAAFEADPERYDLVMTDFVMPNMNGEEVSHAVRTQRPDCPIIICTAYQPATLDAQSLAPLKLMQKPVDPVRLDRTIRSLLDTKQ